MRRSTWALPFVLLVAACSGRGDDRGTITVLAAASMRGALEDVARQYEAELPEVDVELSFDGSSSLAAALLQGAPGDVFVSADEATMDQLVEEGLVEGDPRVVARNRLTLVVQRGNPLGISGLGDLEGALLALCQPQVPCGAYATEAFERAGVSAPRAGDERSVAGVLTRVQLGEADAGLVYATDIQDAADVEGIDLGDAAVEARYPAAVLADARGLVAAEQFLDLLLRPEGQLILRQHGFGAP